MAPEGWEESFHFPRPASDDWVIMQCRTNKRAAWAAQLAADAGLTRCLIYKQVGPLLACHAVSGKVSAGTPAFRQGRFLHQPHCVSLVMYIPDQSTAAAGVTGHKV